MSGWFPREEVFFTPNQPHRSYQGGSPGKKCFFTSSQPHRSYQGGSPGKKCFLHPANLTGHVRVVPQGKSVFYTQPTSQVMSGWFPREEVIFYTQPTSQVISGWFSRKKVFFTPNQPHRSCQGGSPGKKSFFTPSQPHRSHLGNFKGKVSDWNKKADRLQTKNDPQSIVDITGNSDPVNVMHWQHCTYRSKFSPSWALGSILHAIWSEFKCLQSYSLGIRLLVLLKFWLAVHNKFFFGIWILLLTICNTFPTSFYQICCFTWRHISQSRKPNHSHADVSWPVDHRSYQGQTKVAKSRAKNLTYCSWHVTYFFFFLSGKTTTGKKWTRKMETIKAEFLVAGKAVFYF